MELYRVRLRRTSQIARQKPMVGRRRRRRSIRRRPDRRVTSACPTLSVVISSPCKKISGREARPRCLCQYQIPVVESLGLDSSLTVSDRYLAAMKLLSCATFSFSSYTRFMANSLEHYLNVIFLDHTEPDLAKATQADSVLPHPQRNVSPLKMPIDPFLGI